MVASPTVETQITSNDIERARAVIRDYVRTTPILRLTPRDLGLLSPTVLKLELCQHTGSFKPRGAFTRVLTNDVPQPGVIVASGGNAGLGVAHAAKTLGHRVEVFVPRTAPKIKVARLRHAGAHVFLSGDDFAEALIACERRATETGALFVHAYDQPEVVAGQGTVAAEFADQAPDIDTLLVAVGGGGLLAGVASWFAGSCKVVAVEPERCPTFHEARAAGRPVDVAVSGIAADALGARRLGAIAWTAGKYVVDSILVGDSDIVEAWRRLWSEARIPAEPGGAAALAALFSGAYRPAPDEVVGVIICGGNGDPSSHENY